MSASFSYNKAVHQSCKHNPVLTHLSSSAPTLYFLYSFSTFDL